MRDELGGISAVLTHTPENIRRRRRGAGSRGSVAESASVMNEDGSELFGLSKVDRQSETDSHSGSDSDSKSESGSKSDSNSDSDSDSNSSSEANSASEPNSPSNSSPPSPPSSPPAPSLHLDASTSTSPNHLFTSRKADIASSAFVDSSDNHVRLPPDTPLDELALRGLKTIELEVGQEEEEEEEKRDEQLKIGFWKEWEKEEKEKDMRTDPEPLHAVFPFPDDKPIINSHPNPDPINPTTITPNHPSRSTLPPPQTPIISNPTNPPAATLPHNQSPLAGKSEGRITRLTLDDLLALENDDPSSLSASITG